MNSRMVTTLSIGALILVTATVGYGLEFEVFDEGERPMTSEQWGGVESACRLWERQFLDPITVRINIGWGTVDSTTALGALVCAMTTHPYTAVRGALVDDAHAMFEEAVVEMLPWDYLPVRDVNGNRTDDMITITTANAKALGLTTALDPMYGGALLNNADANIYLNTAIADDFDYDRRDGIHPDKFDFVATVAHEIGHALGFVSATEPQDRNPGLEAHPSTLDMWRFEEFPRPAPHVIGPDIAEWRLITSGPAEYYDSVYNNIPMSHGWYDSGPDPDSGTESGYCHAEHWSGHLGHLMGVAQRGVREGLDAPDVHAVDYIGYDRAPLRARYPWSVFMLAGFFEPEPPRPLPGFGGAFGRFAPPPDPSEVHPPFDADFAVRIGLDFGPGLENRGGMGFVRFENQRAYDGETFKGLSYDLVEDHFNEHPPRDAMNMVPPAILDFYFQSDREGIPFRARIRAGEGGAR